MAGANATERHVLDAGCVDSIAGAQENKRGIAMPGRETEAFVRLCDGRRMRLLMQADGLSLEPAESPAPPVRMPAPDTLSDGAITSGEGRIAAAWLIAPTDRYAHGILGDAVEAGGFAVRLRDGTRYELRLDANSVFEDLRVRLVDLDSDGTDEMVVIRSYLDRGAALAVYRLTADGIAAYAETPPIGLANRWLNPAGAADFDGDGTVEIAYVETPHIGGTLRVFALAKDGLREKDSLHGFSNHAIGSRLLDLAAVIDWNGDGVPDLALPDARRQRLRVVTMAKGRLEELATIDQGSEFRTAILVTDLDADGLPEVIYGLADGTIVLIEP